MKFSDINDAGRLAAKMTGLKARRDAWAKVDVNDTIITRRINANESTSDRLPMLDDDATMHDAIVSAIVVEYVKRIAATEAELKELGVEL